MFKNTARVITLMALAGCGSGLDQRDFEGLRVSGEGNRIGSSLFIGKDGCPSDLTRGDNQKMLPAALAAPLIGIAADFIVDFVGKKLEDQKTGLSGQFLASGNTSENLLGYKCLTVAYGIFGNTINSPDETNGKLNKRILTDLGLVDYPAMYIEFPIAPRLTTIGKADVLEVELSPSYFYYADPISRNPGSRKKNLTMVMALSEASIAAATEITDKSALAIYRLNFGRLEAGKEYSGKSLDQIGAVQTLPADKAKGNLNVTVVVTEAEDPSIALTALISAFNSNKKALSDALKDVIKDALAPEKAK